MRPSFVLIPLVILPIACTSPREKARADSAQALASQQRVLMDKLSAQRDSVSLVLADANLFITKIDNSISRVKGLKPAAARKGSESGLEDQLAARKDLLRRVDALVARSRETARELADLKDKQAKLVAGKLARRTGGVYGIVLKDNLCPKLLHSARRVFFSGQRETKRALTRYSRSRTNS